MLNEFVAALIRIAELQRIDREQRALEACEREKQLRRQQEQERLAKLEAERARDLEKRVQREWQMAGAIEDLVAAVECAASAASASAAPPEWLAWARYRASVLRSQAVSFPMQSGEGRSTQAP